MRKKKLSRSGTMFADNPNARFASEMSHTYDMVRLISCIVYLFPPGDDKSEHWNKFVDTWDTEYPEDPVNYADSPGLNGYVSKLFSNPRDVVMWWALEVPDWFQEDSDERRAQKVYSAAMRSQEVHGKER